MKTSRPSCPVRELGESALCWSTVVTVSCRLLLVPRTAAAGTVTPPPPGKRRAGWHPTGENMEHVAVLHPAPWLKASRWGLKREREANVPPRVQVSAFRLFCLTAGRKVMRFYFAADPQITLKSNIFIQLFSWKVIFTKTRVRILNPRVNIVGVYCEMLPSNGCVETLQQVCHWRLDWSHIYNFIYFQLMKSFKSKWRFFSRNLFLKKINSH